MSQLQRNQDADPSKLISTKLAPPRLRSTLVPRELLLARLDEGLEHKLILLSAPAGFGKTTLVSQWLYERTGEQGSKSPLPHRTPALLRTAWVSLDAGDNDPVRFWRYVITAGQAFDVAVGRSALALLHMSQPSYEAVLTMFINELARLPGQGFLVLEDYHVITSPQIHETLTFLLDHLPAPLHLMLVTRSDPPLPLARLRANGDLYELRAADLRFSPAETHTFLQQALPFSLPSQAIERLEAHTEGWVAGLRLAALALQGRQAPQEIEQFLATFAGSHRHILEYLTTEVFFSQPEPLQEFLLQTAFLSRLTASLADAVTGRADSALVLDQLEQANLFLVPLDGAGQWYRYHSLFAEALQEYARRRFDEAGLCDLYNKASLWYEQQGLLVEAIETALSAQEFERAASLIERLVEPRGFNSREVHTLRRWLELLPEAVLYTQPTLCLLYAMAVLFTSDRSSPATAALLQDPLSVAEQAWQAEVDRPKLGKVLAFRALMCWLQGDSGPSFAAARQALELLLEADALWRGISLVFIGVEELWLGHLTAAQKTFIQALALCKTAENHYGMLDTSVLLGQVCLGQGELRQAAQFYRQVLTEAEQAPMDREQALIRRGRALTNGLSALELEWNALEQAEQSASEGLDLGQQYGDEELVVRSNLILARVRQARGETAQAQQLLHTLVAQTKRPLLREAQAAQARLALAAGDLAAVQRWAANRVQIEDNLPRLQQEREALIFARLLIAQDQAETALRSLEEWQAEAQAQGRNGSELEILLLKSLAYFRLNNLPQARQTLSEALPLAQPEGYQRLFLDEGEPMAALLQAVLPDLSEEPLLAYAQALLAAFPSFESPAPGLDFGFQHQPPTANLRPAGGPSAIQNLVEPLSPQEERVLRLLAAGLSNLEIARELIVSINTVKTQVKSIYRKLNVHSRREARDAAHRLKLLQ